KGARRSLRVGGGDEGRARSRPTAGEVRDSSPHLWWLGACNNVASRAAYDRGAIGIAHAPLLPIASFYTATTWYVLAKYRRDHRRCHIDPAWGREHLAWHYDHHTGANQHRNWGVTFQWFDELVGTRDAYVGSTKELADRPRNDERAREAMASQTKRISWRAAWRAASR